MGRNIIPFELRPGKDDDIEKALKEATSKEVNRSTIIREALRQYFNKKSHLHTPIFHQNENIPPSHPLPLPNNIELQRKEKDDTQLDVAIDDLLNF